MASDNPYMLRDRQSPRWSPGRSPQFVQTPGGCVFAVVQSIPMDQEVHGEHWIVRFSYRAGRHYFYNLENDYRQWVPPPPPHVLLLPVEVARENARRRWGAGLPFFYRQGNFQEDGFHAAGDISAPPPAIAQCNLEFVSHPAGVGLRVGAAPPVPWPSPSLWPREVFFGVDSAFFTSLAVELALQEEGTVRSAMAQPDALVAEALRRATVTFREHLLGHHPADVPSST